jgi:hypothetical protein
VKVAFGGTVEKAEKGERILNLKARMKSQQLALPTLF